MSIDLKTLNDILDVLVKVTVLAGIPIGLYKYIITTKQERESREYNSYHALDEKYVDFLILCMNNPELDIFDIQFPKDTKKYSTKAKKEYAALLILIAIFERAYLMYKNQTKPFRKRQWKGWDMYIRDYVARANFLQVWDSCNTDEFDKDFFDYMNGVIVEQKKQQKEEDALLLTDSQV